jgi:hypothetical protein
MAVPSEHVRDRHSGACIWREASVLHSRGGGIVRQRVDGPSATESRFLERVAPPAREPRMRQPS